jgi:glycogen debranching enzyme
MDIKELAYKKAEEVIASCTRPKGFYASGLKGGYEAIWARDSVITGLGAALLGPKFKLPLARSLNILKKWQTRPNGQIPNCVGSYNLDRRSDKTYNSIDSSLWFIIGHYAYAHAFRTHGLFKQHKNALARAFVWLRYQDPNEDGLLSQQPTMDWQDAFPHKYGNVINTQALHYAALTLMGGERGKKQAEHIKKVVNGDVAAYLQLYDKKLGYYLPWNWKNHDGDREQEEWFDSLGNILAVLTGLAKHDIAKKIIKYIDKKEINRPYPVKAIWPPIKRGDKEWRSYFTKCDARTPMNYLNGGIWPMIGGFYVAALVKMNEHKKAERELELLAKANMQKLKTRNFKEGYEFNEWLHGKTGKSKGEPYQGWSAGTYIYAYECVKEKRAIYFE